MVITQIEPLKTTIILKPNRSASWSEVKLVVGAIGIFVISIALVWSFLGVWIILPFAGFEVGLLALLMYKVNLACHAKQVITVVSGAIIVECGIKSPSFAWRFCKEQTQLTVIEAETSFDRPTMILSDDQLSIKLGDFLNQSDCKIARKTLKQAGIIEISNRWWKA